MVLASLLLILNPVAPDRPRDIWVFRSVLDKRTRMTSVNLKDDFWVAYDATNCGLYKSWKGDVKLDGSVYTTEHGPQPTAEGLVTFAGPVDKPVWSLVEGGKTVRPRWRGYRLVDNQVMFQYQFELDKGQSIWVKETPEATDKGWTRTFYVDDLKGAKLTLELGNFLNNTPGIVTYNGQAVDLSKPLEIKSGNSEIVYGSTSADKFEAKHGPTVRPETTRRTIKAQDESPLTEGAALRVYEIGKQLSQVPTLVAGQTPNYSTNIATIDLNKPEHFGGIKDYYYAEVTGFLVIPEDGSYDFRLHSDDGSKLEINGNEVVNHDGLHGSEPPAEGTVTLKKGLVPFKVEMFENEADELLRLSWRKSGVGNFEVIPTASLRTPRGEVKVTAPGLKLMLDPARRDRPGDGRPQEKVHPSFDLATVRPESFKPKVGGIDFLPDGRMVVCNWEPDGGVYILSGVNEPEPHDITVKRFAFGMAEPLGVKVVNGDIYVLQKHELTKLIDRDGDGEADEYFSVANGWGVTSNFHEFAFGLVYEKGYFYANLATAINPGGTSTRPQNHDRGRVLKISEKDGSYSFVAEGLRTPNGIGFGYKGRIFLSDNQGDWLPSSKILELKEGAFYGNRAVDPEGTATREEMPPLVWLPQNEIGNSPSNPTYLNIGPYKDQMIHGDVTHGGVKRVFVEEVDGVLQGCVFEFIQGLEGGVNRILWGPDNSLFVGGIGSSGNWGQTGKERFGLQRLRYNNRSTFEILAVRAFKNGFEIELTEPLASGIGTDAGDYAVRQWKYVPTEQYGGPKVNDTAMKIEAVNISKDRKKVFLAINGLAAGHVQSIRLGHGLHSQSGKLAWITQGWYTMNKLPNRSKSVAKVSSPTSVTSAEKKEGFKALFDGKSTDAFRGYGKESLPGAWQVKDGVLTLTPGQNGGDIITKEKYSDFELRLDWKVERGGNSGIMYRVDESQRAPWFTGPEYQLLDDDRANDGRDPLTSSASLYAMKPRYYDMVRPVGFWNETKIVAKGKKLEHWLNGAMVVSIEIGSSEWIRLKEKSKFASLEKYGILPEGHIVLQDHGNLTEFRNIRIRKL